MTGDPLDRLRYPIGREQPVAAPTAEDRTGWIADLERLPGALRRAVEGLDDVGLDTPYRDGGWTVRQVVHHVADSHVNGYVRFCLALAEEGRTAALYDQEAWAGLRFPRTGPLEPSLSLLDGLHERWVLMARGLEGEELGRTIEHPAKGVWTVDDLLHHYAWHSMHHLAQITRLKERKGW